MSREKQPTKRWILLVPIILLSIFSVFITWHLVSTEYPTHSDVFFMGVECGVLVVVLLVCIFMIATLLAVIIYRRKHSMYR